MRIETVTGEPARRVAGVVYPPGFSIDALLGEIAAALSARGCRLEGVVQARSEAAAGRPHELALRQVEGRWEVPILEHRGSFSQGCRLDARAIAEVAMRLERALSPSVALLIVNRFGRAESEGHGLRQVLARAALMDVPILAGVRQDYAEAWHQFHGGLGTTLAPDRAAVMAWWTALTAATQPG